MAAPFFRIAVAKASIIAMSVLVASGCSTSAWYSGMKFGAENNCRRQPPGEIDSCLARLNTMSYEQYERQRSGRSL